MKFRQKLQLAIGPILILASYAYFYDVHNYENNCTEICLDEMDAWIGIILARVVVVFSAILHLYLYKKNKHFISGISLKWISQVFCLLAWINIGFVLFSIGSRLIPIQM